MEECQYASIVEVPAKLPAAQTVAAESAAPTLGLGMESEVPPPLPPPNKLPPQAGTLKPIAGE
jgi:hypothetical protein